jgi:spermidine synthase
MAQFGVTTAMVSIVLSVFMAGLGLGSWASGRWLRPSEPSREFSALRLYALMELLIGLSGLVVPVGLTWGRSILEHSGMSSSFGYYVVAGLWVTLTLLPWCTLMGATVPIGMRAIGQMVPSESRRSFSYLYTANVAGAVFGTVVPLFLIELFGFHQTLKIGAASNFLIAISAFALSSRASMHPSAKAAESTPAPVMASGSGSRPLTFLFLSGLTSMAMEVVWMRCYTPYFGTVVYAFAAILAVYLLATLAGSAVYRRWSLLQIPESPALWSGLAAFALLPLLAASPTVGWGRYPRLLLGIVPFTGLLGFITPMLVDRFSGGNPGRAGKAYATNVAGCILGPLLAGFILLPHMSERWALIVLTLPWLVVGLAPLRPSRKSPLSLRLAIYASLMFAAVLIGAGRGYEERYPDRRVFRDATATVIATGSGMNKQILVNGYGMTSLTPITKVMAHLPLAFLRRPPQNALNICFGMGTTFRSLRSWGIPVTVVELVPSVPRLFDYYHSDGQKILQSPLSHLIIDDGRRYLERTDQQYDVITIDPPPPLPTAGSSLLYSKEFYEAAKKRLRAGGILQQWLPDHNAKANVIASIARSIREAFPYVRMFRDEYGIHFLCSEQPLATPSAKELTERMPADALSDFAEWAEPSADGDAGAAYLQFDTLLHHEMPIEGLIALAPDSPALTDDRPINEYYVLWHWRHPRPAARSAAANSVAN